MLKQWKFIYCSLLVLTNLVLPHYIHAQPSRTMAPDKDVQLGVGYIKNAKLPMHNVCIKTSNTHLGSVQKHVAPSYVSDINSIAKNLNINLNARGGWNKFTASAELDYLNAIENSNRSLTFNYQSLITASIGLNNSNYYGTNILNKGGLAAYLDGIDSFIKRCGDSYIQRLDMGAILNVTLRLNFATKLQKHKFKANFQGDVSNIINASNDIKYAIEKNNLKGSIDVIAMQKGGDANRLDMIFGPKEKHNIISCNIENLDACNQAINDILNYAQSHGQWQGQGFADQIKIIDNKLIANSLYPVNIYDATIGYYNNDFGLDIEPIKPSQEILNSREKLNTLYDNSARYLKTLDYIKQGVAFNHLSSNIKNELADSYKVLKKNIALFKDGKAMRCYRPYEMQDCPVITESIETKTINNSSLYKIKLLKDAYYFSSGYYSANNPVILIPNDSEYMSVYDTNLVPIANNINNIKLNPNYDYTKISPRGDYSTIDKDNNIADFSLMPSFFLSNIKQDKNGIGFFGKYLFKVCRNDYYCLLLNYYTEIIPF